MHCGLNTEFLHVNLGGT